MFVNEQQLCFRDNRHIVQCCENGKTYRAFNRSNKSIALFHIDDGQYPTIKKCDYAIEIDDDLVIILIELKGADIKTASEQIYSTIDILNLKCKKVKVLVRIILSKVKLPDIRSSQYIKLERLIASLNGDLKKHCICFEEEV
jgi:hypothetical protein